MIKKVFSMSWLQTWAHIIWSSPNLTTINDTLKILCQCGILLCKKRRISVPKWNFSVIYDFLRDWSRPGLPCFLSLLMLSSQARGTSAKSSLFPSSHKGIFDESMAVWGPSLRSFPAIFTDHGHINKVILISECLQGMVGTSLWMTLTRSVSRVSTNIFKKNWDFRNFLRFSENFEIFGKFWDFRKGLRFSENFDQMPLRLQVSRVTL